MSCESEYEKCHAEKIGHKNYTTINETPRTVVVKDILEIHLKSSIKLRFQHVV